MAFLLALYFARPCRGIRGEIAKQRKEIPSQRRESTSRLNVATLDFGLWTLDFGWTSDFRFRKRRQRSSDRSGLQTNRMSTFCGPAA